MLDFERLVSESIGELVILQTRTRFDETNLNAGIRDKNRVSQSINCVLAFF